MRHLKHIFFTIMCGILLLLSSNVFADYIYMNESNYCYAYPDDVNCVDVNYYPPGYYDIGFGFYPVWFWGDGRRFEGVRGSGPSFHHENFRGGEFHDRGFHGGEPQGSHGWNGGGHHR